MGDERAELNDVVALDDRGQPRDARQVDHAGGAAIGAPAHPALDLQQQVGGAGERARILAVFGFQVERFFQRVR
nr:hypothetical protein [Caldilinea sp.]